MDPSLAEWRGFYAAVANATAALVGLVFVGASIRLAGRRADVRLRTLATMAVLGFLHPLFASLGMLLPVSQRALGAGLLVLALSGTAGAIAIDRSVARAGRHGRRLWIAYRYHVPVAAEVILVLASVSFLGGAAVAPYAVAVFVFLMIVVGAQNTWDLLLGSTDAPHLVGDIAAERPSAAAIDRNDEHERRTGWRRSRM